MNSSYLTPLRYQTGDGAFLGFSNTCGDIALSTNGLSFWAAPKASRGLLGSPSVLAGAAVGGGNGKWTEGKSSIEVSASVLPRGGLPPPELFVTEVPVDASFLCVRSRKQY